MLETVQLSVAAFSFEGSSVKAWNLIIGFQSVDFQHIPREKNKEADKLVNQALDEQK